MNDERICFCEIHRPLAVVGAESGVELSSSQVGKEEDVGGQVPDPKGVCEMGCFEGSTKRAQAHGDACGLGPLGQVEVDALGFRGAPGHGRNE